MDEGSRLITMLRSWAGQEQGEGCAACGMEFYNRDANPVCRGCRLDTPYKRELLRARLLRVLASAARRRGRSGKP